MNLMFTTYLSSCRLDWFDSDNILCLPVVVHGSYSRQGMDDGAGTVSRVQRALSQPLPGPGRKDFWQMGKVSKIMIGQFWVSENTYTY